MAWASHAMLRGISSVRCMFVIIRSSARCKKSVTKFSAPDSHFTSGSSLMQSDSGLLRWLKVPSLYNAFQGPVGGNLLRRRLIEIILAAINDLRDALPCLLTFRWLILHHLKSDQRLAY